ncbi:MAG: ATP-binding protein involved in chromosome partitioning [Candidatus Tokpelaia sp. JSC085]|nr:MAG: ATP-binding protein involved in chromosome partitioning [Candidatus Tokpelaia sp. JSC085]
MDVISHTDILNRLKKISGPDFTGDIVSLGLVSDIFISDGKVFFSITVSAERAEELEPLRQSAARAVAAIDGVKAAIVTLTAEKKTTCHNSIPQSSRVAFRTRLTGVKHIIAVASGKGGVGKSTTAINLALALKESGLAIGLLDADIYGPSLPRLASVHSDPERYNKKLHPIEKYGLKMMSMGFLVDEDTPVIWRGPMVMSAVTQMLRDVSWAPLDILVVDMPPGTGDAQLTLAQRVQLSGSVIVSTPQDLALIDARKSIEMFTKVDVPILGMIENMSYFIAPDTGKRYDIFGHGGVRHEAVKKGVTFLGEVPLDPQIRYASDKGNPVVLTDPNSQYAVLYREAAQVIIRKLALRSVSSSC